MTALNVIQRAGEILVMTDGLGLVAGAPPRPIQKVSFLPHLPAIFAIRGLNASLAFFVAKFDEVGDGTFEGFLDFTPQFAAQLIPELAARQHAPPTSNELHVVGYSTRRSRLEHYFLTTGDNYLSVGRERYKLYLEEEPMTAAPQPSEESLTASKFKWVPAKKFDPLDHGIKLMDAQRRTYPGHIGEFVQLSRVTRDGISSRIVHRWPSVEP